jgi:hypothetical protein
MAEADTPVAVAVAAASAACPSVAHYLLVWTHRFDACNNCEHDPSSEIAKLHTTRTTLYPRYYNRLLRGLTVSNFDRLFRVQKIHTAVLHFFFALV